MAAAFCTKCGQPFPSDEARFCAQCGTPRAERDVPHGTDDKEGKSKAGGRIATLSILAVLIGLIVPVVMIMDFGGGGLFGSSVEGALTVKGGPYGAFRFVPTACDSMAPFGRVGANVHGDGPNDGGVYVTADPLQGTRVDVEVPGSCRNADGTDCTVFQVPRDHCTRWEVGAEFTGTVINDVRQYEGYARLTCMLDDGTSVEGDLVFDGC